MDDFREDSLKAKKLGQFQGSCLEMWWCLLLLGLEDRSVKTVCLICISGKDLSKERFVVVFEDWCLNSRGLDQILGMIPEMREVCR